MTQTRISGSFRDPSGFVFRHDGVLYRQVNQVYRPHYDAAVESGFFRAAMDEGLLVPHVEVPLAQVPHDDGASVMLRPDELPFVSYPYEWCVSQLQDAALLTLALQRRALEHGLWLKDASAYNVQFVGCNPVFIDNRDNPGHKQDSWEMYQAVKPNMVHVHVKDGRWNKAKNDADYTFPGEGDGQTERIMADLV